MSDRVQRRRDYLRWHPAQVITGDIDPMYPVLRSVARARGYGPERTAWLCFLHVAWYHPGSTLVASRLVEAAERLPRTPEGLERAGLLSLPCETERRGHRSEPALARHLLGLREAFAEDGAWGWVKRSVAGAQSPREAWTLLNAALTTLPGNGRWAAYKTAEMLQKVAGLPVVATDAGNKFSSGPRKGLDLIEPGCPTDNSAASVELLDEMVLHWAMELGESDIAQVETSLCDFNSLAGGRYYLGHDIDSMLGAFRHPKVRGRISHVAWEARRESFDPWMLGELHDWDGVRRDFNTHYRNTGEMLYV